MIVASYVPPITTHLLKPDGKTLCGRSPKGSRWVIEVIESIGVVGVVGVVGVADRKVCRKCERGLRGLERGLQQAQGFSRLFSHCPKCLSDLGQQIPLTPDRSCPNCKGRWG